MHKQTQIPNLSKHLYHSNVNGNDSKYHLELETEKLAHLGLLRVPCLLNPRGGLWSLMQDRARIAVS